MTYKAKIFTIWPYIEKVCGPLTSSIYRKLLQINGGGELTQFKKTKTWQTTGIGTH